MFCISNITCPTLNNNMTYIQVIVVKYSDMYLYSAKTLLFLLHFNPYPANV